MKLILGSGSTTRKQVLTEMGYAFEIMVPDIDERAIRREDPRELVLAITHAKMDAILERVTEPALIICADQFLTVDGVVREKPVSNEEAYAFMSTFDQNPQRSYIGLVIANTQTGKRLEHVEEMTVTFDPIPQENIVSFVESGKALQCAGALAVEHPLMAAYAHYNGEREAIMGLPKAATLRMLSELDE